jgi:hypothetical protein
MSQVTVVAERVMCAPANVVYAILSNYREHHPAILPPAFSEFYVERGGIGAGTVISFKYRAPRGVRSFRDLVAEPTPGSVLTESDATGRTDKVTTFTITPLGQSSRVRIETHWRRMASKDWWSGSLQRGSCARACSLSSTGSIATQWSSCKRTG